MTNGWGLVGCWLAGFTAALGLVLVGEGPLRMVGYTGVAGLALVSGGLWKYLDEMEGAASG